MKDKQQTMRYSDEELRIIKNVFAENDDLLKRLRKVMLQMPLNGVDERILESIKKPEVLAILRKIFLPTLDADAPIGQQLDLWMTIQFIDKTVNEAFPHLMARKKLIQYLDQQLEVLESGKKGKIKFDELANTNNLEKKGLWDMYVDMIVRNTIISHTEQQLAILRVLGGFKNETLEETQERLNKDSNK